MCSLLVSGCDVPDLFTNDRATFHSQPAALGTCMSNATVMLSWDARRSGAQDVAIFVRQHNAETLFAHGGPEGSGQTGPWVQPGTVFKLRTKDGGRELASLTVGSKDCDPIVFEAQPAALSACTSNAVVRLSWDARSSGAQTVAVFVGERDNERLLGQGGAEGSQETGPWARPNMVFTLRARDSLRELGRLTVGSTDCDPATFTAQPAALSACSPGTIVRLSWDARAGGHQGVALLLSLPDGDRVFAAGGPQGSQETGPWARPNMLFMLKSGDQSRELARLTLGVESCDPAGKNRRLGESRSEYARSRGRAGM
jgi:hypothetical protein